MNKKAYHFKPVLSFLLFVLVFSANGQSGFEPRNQAIKICHRPGYVIVQFTDAVKPDFDKKGKVLTTGQPFIDKVFSEWQITQCRKIFVGAEYESHRKKITLAGGQEKELSQLHNVYTLKFRESLDAKQLVKELEAMPEVVYAEVDKAVFIYGLIPSTPEEIREIPRLGPTNLTPNDPLYEEQWWLEPVKADLAWETTTGDTTEVIAILDTGVDYGHPDLQNKIWNNSGEIPGNGIDDDGNGYVDDIRGWDCVNHDNSPMDDNGHGTHCAGIAGAESNNGIGISGVSWGAKIMPVKVFQSNGVGYISQIAEGIWYAAQNGATIFSNSWGGYGESITTRLAFEYAYSQGPIVAAAGNNYYKIDHPTPPFPITAQLFPASYNWVLGVEATQWGGSNAWFSNFDPTGPVVSDGRPYDMIYYNDFDWNYEVRAPGLGLLSTVPDGQYRYYSGTSMAAPIVSGAIALIKSHNPGLSNEQVFARLIQLNKINRFMAGVMDINESMLNIPPPDIYYKGYTITDSLGDNDGRADAGETIGIDIAIKNAGGSADSIWAQIDFAEFEDTTTVNLLTDSVSFGNISPYGTTTSNQTFDMVINPELADGRWVSLQLTINY